MLRWRWCLCFLIIVLALAGCGRLAPTPEPVTITFVRPEDATGFYETWVQEFQELHPHITVELINRGDVSYALIPQEDAFTASQFELNSLLQQGSVLNLSPFMEQTEDVAMEDFYAGAADVFSSQGKQWALPFGVDMMVMYYNQDLFDRYGAPYPEIGWDWGDFLERAQIVNEPEEVFGYAMQYEGEFSVYEPVMLMYQHNGGIFDSLENPTELTFNMQMNIEALQWYVDLIHRHGVSPTPVQMQRMGRPYPWRGVMEGRFAMWLGMLQDRGGLTWPREWNMAWGVVPLPRHEQAATLGLADGLFVSAQSEHPDEAWQWISFLSHKMHPALMPARRSLAESAEFEQRVGPDVADAARASIQMAVLVNPDVMGFERPLELFAESLAVVRAGEMTPEAALDAAQALAE